MAASVTHLVIGERVFSRAPYIGSAQGAYGAFLMGCILVDVHAFHPIDRRVAHLVGRVEEDGEAAYRSSCANFLQQRERLLRRPWAQLDGIERAFAAGYLCHLAVDERWKELGKNILEKLGNITWQELPVPPDISLTAFDFLSFPRLKDPARTLAQLRTAPIPDLFCHVPHALFLSQWRIIQEYVFAGGTVDAHLAMLEKAGRPTAEIQAARASYPQLWGEALDFTEAVVGGVDPFLAEAADHALKVLPELYTGDA